MRSFSGHTLGWDVPLRVKARTEGLMQFRRRHFMAGTVAAGLLGGAGWCALLPAGQSQQRPPRPPPDRQDPNAREDENEPPLPSRKKALEENDKDIKKSVQKLFQLASDLKAEVEKTDSSNVLSMAMVRKAEEIERLARDIKNRAKG